jgi:hypothetical protein
MRTILKFDVGKDGFEKMITVLAIFATVTLVAGIIFLNLSIKHCKN